MNLKYLLGATNNNEIVFAEIEIYEHRNKPKEFTASFCSVRPFDAASINLNDYVENYVYSMDKESILDELERFDCRPSELVACLIDETSDVTEWVDCSVYPEWFVVNDHNWYFESCSSGQHDFRNEMKVYTNKEAFDRLYEIWDTYHLETVTDEIVKEVTDIIKKLLETDEIRWIEDYIKNHYKELGGC